MSFPKLLAGETLRVPIHSEGQITGDLHIEWCKREDGALVLQLGIWPDDDGDVAGGTGGTYCELDEELARLLVENVRSKYDEARELSRDPRL